MSSTINNPTMTLAEFQRLRRMLPILKVRIGAPPRDTRETNRVRCGACRKHLWDCRCHGREGVMEAPCP